MKQCGSDCCVGWRWVVVWRMLRSGGLRRLQVHHQGIVFVVEGYPVVWISAEYVNFLHTARCPLQCCFELADTLC